MIRKYTFGLPIDTNAVIAEIKSEDILSFPLELKTGERLQISFDLLSDEMIFGLGEAIRGINKRGWTYESWCSDETNHTEDKKALYGSHNFIVVGDRFALFVDFAGKVEWDLGYDKPDRAVITLDGKRYGRSVQKNHRQKLHSAALGIRISAELLGLRDSGGFLYRP